MSSRRLIVNLLFSLFVLFPLSLHVLASAPVSEGVADLRNWNPDESPTVPLDGRWQAATNRLLEPGEQFPRHYLPVPSTWKDVGLPTEGFVTYKLTIHLPENSPPLALKIPIQNSSWRLWVNGKLTDSVGEPGRSERDTHLVWTERILSLPDTKQVELVWQLSNYLHYTGGSKRPIYLGTEAELSKQYQLQYLVMTFGAGGYLFFGLYFLLLFLLHRRNFLLLSFGSLSLVIVVRSLVAHKIEGNILLESFNYFTFPRILEWCSAWLYTGLYPVILKQLFPNSYNLNVIRGIFITSIFLAICTFSDTLLQSKTFMTIFIQLGVIITAYTYIGLFKAVINNNRGSLPIFLVDTIVISSIVHDAWAILTDDMDIMLSPYTVYLWVMAIAFVVGDRTHQGLKLASERSRELDSLLVDRNKELSDKVDELEKAQTTLSRENKAKSHFISMLSHELRTPLNGMQATVQALHQHQLEPQQHRMISALKSTSDMITMLIEQLLDQTRIEQGRLTFNKVPFNPNTLLENTVCLLHSFADNKRLDLNLEIKGFPLCLEGDNHRLQLVLLHVIHYCIRTTDHGKVSVSAQSQSVVGKRWKLKLQVLDTSQGLSSKQKSQLFRTYHDVGTEGLDTYTSSGLGLGICNSIIRAMGGSIQLSSEPGYGNHFTINLTLPEGTPNSSTTLTLSRHYHILVVDDDPLNHQVIHLLLPPNKCTIVSASSGEEALELLSPEIDIVLIDIQMYPMTGIELLRSIRALNRDNLNQLPLYAYTANLIPEQVQEIEALFDGIIRKPASQPALFQMLNSLPQRQSALQSPA
ncbi:response regulator [Parendozoicomonas sp. Alg238-R29]|uniref:response regulator n=1 Tax=Parendozoicomonas sp. Alg238-R29 TaxID=2993446 RepID=UPI00248E2B97|nr:response regulator [Parendozoicomonas sp. Alg238-R29]